MRARLVLVAAVLAAWFGAGTIADSLRAQSIRVPVVLISVDGLKPDYVLNADALKLKVPNLRRFVAEGSYSTGVRGVTPTVTYPSHTTLITGVSPAEHGILNNSPFDPLGTNDNGWYWYAEDVKVPTLWDVANDAGLVTANVDWPVSVGGHARYNIAQFWRAPIARPPGGDEDHKLLRALSTPGLLDEAEHDLGPYPAGYRYDPPDDERRAAFMAWMIAHKKPDLLTGYFASLDEAQHARGPYDQQTLDTVEHIDTLIGQVRAAAQQMWGSRFVMAVASDHGHIRTDRAVQFNAALRDAGLIDVDARGKVTAWRAFSWNAGGSAAIVISQPASAETQARVRRVIQTIVDDPSAPVARVIEGDEIRASGGFPGTMLVVGLKPGFRTGVALSGSLVTPVASPGGTHGFLPDTSEMNASFFVAGDGVPVGRNLGPIDMRDVAPTLATKLGVTLTRATGRRQF
ncbi:MAG: ectonucleotide pyrophosphatase/phosphodiesterase [Vicinamibacterales bacterium]